MPFWLKCLEKRVKIVGVYITRSEVGIVLPLESHPRKECEHRLLPACMIEYCAATFTIQ